VLVDTGAFFFPLADSLDHAGPITGTVRDGALTLQ
jgi:Asp-tRNA(Asn)/Glu-tRNA(Gln) amidotransferase A subunit family amidase